MHLFNGSRENHQQIASALNVDTAYWFIEPFILLSSQNQSNIIRTDHRDSNNKNAHLGVVKYLGLSGCMKVIIGAEAPNLTNRLPGI